MKTLSSLLNPKFATQTQSLLHIDRLLKSALPAAIHPHVQVANIADHELVVITDTPAWSTRLRLHTHDMLYMLATHTNYGITTIRIRLITNSSIIKKLKAVNKPILLSKNSARLIQQTANCITDSDLRNSLLQLATRVKPDD